MPFIYHRTPPASQKGVDILLAGTQELQEVHILVPACLRNTQKNEVFLNSRGRRRPFNDVPQRGKRLHRVLGVIVVPWHAVIVEKSKEFLAVLLKTLFALRRHVALPLL